MLASNRFEPRNRRYDDPSKDEESKVWNCLRSKATVVLLISLFVMEALAALGLGIYYWKQQDGTLPPLFGTTNANCYYDDQDNAAFTGEKFTENLLLLAHEWEVSFLLTFRHAKLGDATSLRG